MNVRWNRNEMEKKSFILGILYEWARSFILHCNTNKKPSLQRKDWVIFTSPFTAFQRRLNVKRIQAGFLAYGSS